MSNGIKSVALCLFSILIAFVLFNTFLSNKTKNEPSQVEYAKYLEEQDQLYRDQMTKADNQNEIVDRQLAKQEELLKRHEAVIQRWEQQADRTDALLSKQENQ